MLGPDGIDRVQYVPPDKIKALQRADPDKKHKFSRVLEEEEEELEKRRQKRHEDEVDIDPDLRANGDEKEETKDSEDSEGQPDTVAPDENDETELESSKSDDTVEPVEEPVVRIDVKA